MNEIKGQLLNRFWLNLVFGGQENLILQSNSFLWIFL